jgi:hypothetical protein
VAVGSAEGEERRIVCSSADIEENLRRKPSEGHFS